MILGKLSTATSRKLDWVRISDVMVVALGNGLADRSPGARTPLENIDQEKVRQAFAHVEEEFKRVLGPLEKTLYVVMALVLAALAVALAGAAISFINPWGGAAIGTVGVVTMLTCLSKAWQLRRDQAMLELLPSRYELALSLCKTQEQYKQFLERFLSETSSLKSK
jgi:hypothetical protein